MLTRRGFAGFACAICAELCFYDFPYNERMKLGVSDAERTAKAIKGIVGKHLIYRRPQKVAQSSGY
jgi:hypothetical protein